MSAPQTPSQTVGPYFSMVLATDDAEAVVAPPGTEGERVVLRGRLLDGEGVPVEDGLVELWQADRSGRYRHPLDDRDEPTATARFTGFGRARTAFETGEWRFETVRPGRVPGPGDTLQAPHVNLVLQARGMLDPVWTRLYFDDEGDANADDAVLAAVPAERRGTLVATAAGTDEEGRAVFTLDVHLQGPHETVFLDW